MTCPNLSHPTYKSIKSQYGEFAQYVASSLFDNPNFQKWKGDDEIPSINDKGEVLSNSGSTFPLSTYFSEVLTNAKNQLQPTSVEAFNKSEDGRYYEASLTPQGIQLSFRESIPAKFEDLSVAETKKIEEFTYKTPLTTEQLLKTGAAQIDSASINSTEAQEKTLSILKDSHSRMKFEEAGHTYQDEAGIVYNSVSDTIGNTFNGNKDEYAINAEWGTQAHSLLEDIINGETPRVTPLLSENARRVFIPFFEKLVKDLTKDGSKLLSESILYNTDAKVAGKSDLIVVHPDGSISIFDLKSSVNSTLNGAYDKVYTKGQISRSKRDQNSTQLGTYSYLAQKLGISVRDLRVVPIHLESVGDKVSKAIPEPIIEITAPTKEVESIINRRIANLSKSSESQKAYSKALDELKILIQEKIDKIKQSLVSKKSNSTKRLGELKELQQKLVGVDAIKGVSEVIDAIHNELVINKEGKKTYSERFDDIVNTMEVGLATGDINTVRQTMQKLNAYKEYVDDYKDLDQYLELFSANTSTTIKGDKDSPIEKLREIATVRVAMQQGYYKATRPLLAASLSKEISESANKAAMQYLDSKSKLLNLAMEARIAGNFTKEKYYRDRYDKARETYEKLHTSESKIVDQLEKVSDDLGMLEFLSGTLSNSSDTILGLFAKKIKATYARIDEFMFKFQHEASEQFLKFKKATKRNQDNPQDFNKGLYETIKVFSKADNGSWKAHEEIHFVQEVDQTKWNIELNKMFEVAASLDDEKKAKSYMAEWFADNTIPKSDEEIDKILTEKLLDLHSGYITKEEYDKWMSRNISEFDGVSTYMRDLAKPSLTKYSNPKYQEIQNNPAMKEYYDYLLSSYKKAQEKYPISKRMGTRLPSINKGSIDLIREKGGIKKLGQNIKDSILSTYQDADRYKSGQVVPTYFTQFMPADQVSVDLLSSIVKFTQAAETYEAIAGNVDSVGLETEAKSLLNVIQERDIERTDSKSKTILKDAAVKLGLTDAEIEKKGGLHAAFLKHFIDQNLYGVGEDKILLSIPTIHVNGKEYGGGQVDTAKLTNTFISLASWPALGGPFTILKSIANKLNAEANVFVEGFAKQYISQGDLIRGKGIYNKWVASSMLKDYASPIPTSLEGQLMEWFSPIQGEFRDKVGDDLSWSGFKRAFVPGSWFFLQKAGEHSAQMSMFFGFLNATKVRRVIPGTVASQEIRLKDAYELDEHGLLRLKDGVEFSDKDKDAFVNRIHAINKGLHGVYNKMDKSVAQKQAIGRLAFMYRKFLVPAVKRRWGAIRTDQELGDTVEGFHRTLVNTAINDFRELINFYLKRATKLTPMEEANLRRSTSELALIVTLSVLIAGLTGYRDKHPELKKNKDTLSLANVFNGFTYEAMRIHSEFQFFIPGLGTGDQLRVFTSPSAANSTLQKLFNLSRQIFSPTETYAQSSQWHKKGDSKLLASLSSLLGLNGLDSKRAQQQFNKLY